MTQMTGKPRSNFGQVSVAQRGRCPRPHQRVGGQPPASPDLLGLSPKDIKKPLCLAICSFEIHSPGTVIFFPLSNGHVDVAAGGAITDPHTDSAGQGHPQQTNEEYLISN